ncbi:inositol monophosphatase family protein [Enterococcus songbeiensis]|uniref:inositol monophosphatase family protein n=1 Tax=Enterococcus songbeiensis TaxID=2559927 RepID=UPI0010F7E5DD|nr:inositol monophosphatase family protein [Enterococcus songbeiensis]
MDEMIDQIKSWIYQAGETIKENLNETVLQVETKSSRKDLVTNLDKATQDFLTAKILAFDPEAKILGEENGRDKLMDLQGRVFIIDPIDGTMNFVLEQENFCIMVAVYEQGIGRFGFVYNVMKDEFLWGGKEIGVFCNDRKITPPKNLALNEGMVGMNTNLYKQNAFNCQKIGDIAMGVRMSGCAGKELIGIALGRRNGYISNLAPWDYAPGDVLLEALGMKFSAIDGEPLKLDGRELFLAGTPAAYEEMRAIIQEA